MSEIDGYAKWGLGSARMGLYNFRLASANRDSGSRAMRGSQWESYESCEISGSTSSRSPRSQDSDTEAAVSAQLLRNSRVSASVADILKQERP